MHRQHAVDALPWARACHVLAQVSAARVERVEARGREPVEDGTEHGHGLRLEVARAEVEGVDRVADTRLAHQQHRRCTGDGEVRRRAANDRAD